LLAQAAVIVVVVITYVMNMRTGPKLSAGSRALMRDISE